jgi:hypothetical protein
MLLMRWASVTCALPVLVPVRRKNSAGERETAPYGRQARLRECEVAHTALWSQRASSDLSTRF